MTQNMDIILGEAEGPKSEAEAKHLHFDKGTSAYSLCAAFGTGKRQLTTKLVNALGKRLKEEGFSKALSRAQAAGGASVCLVTWNPETQEFEGLPEPPEPTA